MEIKYHKLGRHGVRGCYATLFIPLFSTVAFNCVFAIFAIAIN